MIACYWQFQLIFMYNCAKVIGQNNSSDNRSSSSGLVRDMSSYFSSRKITKMVWSNILREGCQSYVTDGSNFLFVVTHDCECCVPHPKTLNVSNFSIHHIIPTFDFTASVCLQEKLQSIRNHPGEGQQQLLSAVPPPCIAITGIDYYQRQTPLER